MHKSQTHTEEGFQTSRNSDSRYIATIGISLIAVLVLLFLISTIFNSNGSDEEPAGMPQVVPAEDSLPAIENFNEEVPQFWLQARALSTGNAGWGPDITAPFDTLWHMRSNAGREFFSSPALVDGTLYFGCNDGNLRAVDAVTGSVKWTFGTACGICGEPAVNSTTVYFGGQDGVVYAIDRFSGNELWSSGLGYHVFCDTGILSDTLIVTGNSMGKVCALNARTGEPVWDDEIGGIVLGPVIVDSIIIFSTEGGKIAAFDPSGNQLWSKDYSSQASPPSADSTGVYAGFSNGAVRKFSLDDGHVLWETDVVSSVSRCVMARPVIAGNRVLSGTNDGQLVSLTAAGGTVIWRQNFDNWLQLPPVVGKELVYIACDDQRLHIVELETGAKVDSLEMDGYSGTAPLLRNGTIYYGNTSGDFVALLGTIREEEAIEPVEEQLEELLEELIEEQPEELIEEQPEELPEEVVEEVVAEDEEAPAEMIQALPENTGDEPACDTDSTETE